MDQKIGALGRSGNMGVKIEDASLTAKKLVKKQLLKGRTELHIVTGPKP
jgi:hypothetical protein